MYSHTENIVTVTARDHQLKPVSWAIVGTRELDVRGRVIAERIYKDPMPATAGGTRIA